MADIDIAGRLRDSFVDSLGHYESRHIIEWHDPDGESSDVMAKMGECA